MELSEELLKNLKENNAFRIYVAYVSEKIDELDTVSGLEGESNEIAGENAKVRLLTIKTLNEILAPILNLRERVEPSPEAIQNRKYKFGL